MSKISIRFYNDREVRAIWDESATHKKYLLVRQEGKRQVQREIDHPSEY